MPVTFACAAVRRLRLRVERSDEGRCKIQFIISPLDLVIPSFVTCHVNGALQHAAK